MPFNGSGTFSVVYNWVSDAAAGIKILASRQDTQWADVATNGLSNVICKDGQTTTTAIVPFAGGGITADTIGEVTANAGVAIRGCRTNSSAAAGYKGEYMESSVASGAPVALVTAIAKTVTSLTLTPGDWDVTAQIGFIGDPTTTVTYLIGSISSATNTLNTNRSDQLTAGATIFTTLGTVNFAVYPVRFSINVNTPVFLVAQSAFGVASNTAFGVLRARRVQ